jgi:hypothetical protein
VVARLVLDKFLFLLLNILWKEGKFLSSTSPILLNQKWIVLGLKVSFLGEKALFGRVTV